MRIVNCLEILTQIAIMIQKIHIYLRYDLKKKTIGKNHFTKSLSLFQLTINSLFPINTSLCFLIIEEISDDDYQAGRNNKIVSHA